jgi:hypothetical protein
VLRKILVVSLIACCLGTIQSFAAPAPFTGIVASESFIGITQNITDHVLFTPWQDGVYRVIIAADGSVNDNGNMVIDLSWIAPRYRDSVINGNIDLHQGGAVSLFTPGSFVLRVAGGTPILLSCPYAGDPRYHPNPTDLFVIIERLQ